MQVAVSENTDLLNLKAHAKSDAILAPRTKYVLKINFNKASGTAVNTR